MYSVIRCNVPAMRMVIVATPIKAHTTNIDRPAGDAGAKSPYPVVVKAKKPEHRFVNRSKQTRMRNVQYVQKYIASP